MTINRLLKFHYLRFLRLKGTPEEVARGIAVGIFIGITPTIPFHTVLVLMVSLFFKANKFAGLLASWVISNPLTFFLQYYLSWRIGSFLLSHEVSWDQIHKILGIVSGHGSFQTSIKELSKLGGSTITVMLVGGIVLALPFTILSYYAALLFFTRKKRLWGKSFIKH
ncbi:MAG: DUF2062 domain-containing protein [Thermodesulfobacteriota bacterium]